MTDERSEGPIFWQSIGLPESLVSAIRRQAPQIDLEELESIADTYRLLPILSFPTARDDKKALAAIEKHASKLMSAITELGSPTRTNLDEKLKVARLPRAKDIRFHVLGLAASCKELRSEIEPPKGPQDSRKNYVVRSIAKALQSAGYEVDASSNGLLVYLTTEILRHCDGVVPDVRSLVRNALR